MVKKINSEIRSAVGELLANYADSIHRIDGNAWSQCWSKNATWLIGTLEEPESLFDITGIEMILPAWEQAMTIYTRVQHKLVSHQVWNIDGVITGRCYVEELMTYNGDEYNLFGVYNDIYQEAKSGYIFKKRQFNILQLQKGNENRKFYSHPNT